MEQHDLEELEQNPPILDLEIEWGWGDGVHWYLVIDKEGKIIHLCFKNPFEVVEEENHDEENMFSEEEPQFMEEDSRHSGISDDEKFAELPPVHVMNNTSKPQSPTKAALDMEEKMRQELLEKERLDEELRRTQELD